MRKLVAMVAAVVVLGVAPSATARPGDIIVGDSSGHKVLRVNPKTGATSTVSDDSRLVSPNDAVFGADGKIYVADYGAFSDNGGVFSIDPKTRKVKVVSDDPLFDQPDGLAMGPDGDLFVTDLNSPDGALFRVDLPSGKTSVVSDDPLLGTGPVGVVVPPDGTPIVANYGVVARVDPISGKASVIADDGDGLSGAGEGLVRAPNGTLYMAEDDAGVKAINPATGKVTDLTGPVPTDGYGLALDFQGRLLTQDTPGLHRVDLRTGAVANVSSAIGYAEGMEVEPPRCGRRTSTIVGSTRRDRLAGSGFDDVIAGLGGRDLLKGKAGGDRLCGGKGKDRIVDTKGTNRINCGAGRHDVVVTNRRSSVNGNCERVIVS